MICDNISQKMSQLALQEEVREVEVLVGKVEKAFDKIIEHYAQERWHTAQLKGKLELYNKYITATFSLLTKYKKMLKSFQNTRKDQKQIAQLIAHIEGTPTRPETLSDSDESEEEDDHFKPLHKKSKQDETTC